MAHVRKHDQIGAGDEVEGVDGQKMRVEEVQGSEAVCTWLMHGVIRRGRFPLGKLRKVVRPEGPPIVDSPPRV